MRVECVRTRAGAEARRRHDSTWRRAASSLHPCAVRHDSCRRCAAAAVDSFVCNELVGYGVCMLPTLLGVHAIEVVSASARETLSVHRLREGAGGEMVRPARRGGAAEGARARTATAGGRARASVRRRRR